MGIAGVSVGYTLLGDVRCNRTPCNYPFVRQVCKLPFTDVPRHYRNIQVRPAGLWGNAGL